MKKISFIVLSSLVLLNACGQKASEDANVKSSDTCHIIGSGLSLTIIGNVVTGSGFSGYRSGDEIRSYSSYEAVYHISGTSVYKGKYGYDYVGQIVCY